MAKPQKRNQKQNENERLENKWESLVNICQDYEYSLDIEDVKKLIYDTYVYFSGFGNDDHLKRDDLRIYRHMSQFLCTQYYPDGWLMSEFDNCMDFVAGQCCLLEFGIESYNFQCSLPLMNMRHIPGGCQQPEADMSSYEAFESSFRDNLECLIEENDEDLYEDD